MSNAPPFTSPHYFLLKVIFIGGVSPFVTAIVDGALPLTVGYSMKSYKPLLFLCLVPALVLASCYHEFPNGGGGGGGGGGGTGTGSVVVTVTSTPSQIFYFPSLNWQILSVDLINSSTTATIVAGSLPPLEFNRLQTDSQFLGKALSPVPAGTYTSAKIQIAPSTASSFFYNSTSSTLLNCASGVVCKIPTTVAGFGATTVTVPVSFTVAANSNTGFSLNFDLSKAVTSAGGMTFDFTKTGAITLTTLPRMGQSSGSLDSLQNFTGNVTAKTSTTIDIASLSSDTRTFTMAAMVEFDDPFNVCGTGQANFNCLVPNQNVSVDANVNADGTLTAYEVDFLDPAPGGNEMEGIIVPPLSSTQFTMVVTNGVGSSSILPGNLATVNLNSASSYFADPKNLGVGVSTTPTGFLSSTDLVVGQTVMLKGGSVNFSTTPNTLSGYTRTLLRYSSIGGTVQTTGNPFTLSAVPTFFINLATNTAQVETFANTTFDNITGGSNGLSGGTGTNVSVRGLYLNPTSGATSPVLAAQVRGH